MYLSLAHVRILILEKEIYFFNWVGVSSVSSFISPVNKVWDLDAIIFEETMTP